MRRWTEVIRVYEHFNFLSLVTAVEEVIISGGLMYLHLILEATAHREGQRQGTFLFSSVHQY